VSGRLKLKGTHRSDRQQNQSEGQDVKGADERENRRVAGALIEKVAGKLSECDPSHGAS